MPTILIAENETTVMAILIAILCRAGYQLVTATSVREAKRKSDDFAGHIDLLITDHMLSDGIGRDAAEYIIHRRPLIKILQISGHSPTELRAEGHLLPGAHFFAKPFRADEFRDMVSQVLVS